MVEKKKQSTGIFRYLWIALGLLSFALGTIGIALPLLPTVPFYMLTAFCFAKGSERLHIWFLGTSLYEKYIVGFLNREGLPLRRKLTICVSVTVLMLLSGYFMSHLTIGLWMLVIVWSIHVLYLFFIVKTIPFEEV